MASEKSEAFASTLTKLIVTTFITAVISHWVTKMFEEKKTAEAVKETKKEIFIQTDSSSNRMLQNFTTEINSLKEENKNIRAQLMQGGTIPAIIPSLNNPQSNGSLSVSGNWVESTGGVALKLMDNNAASLNGIGEMSGMVSGTGTYNISNTGIVVSFANAYLFGESVGSLTYELNLMGNNILSGNAISVMGNNQIAFYKN